MANFFGRRREALWRVDQYRGQRSIDVQATQLEAHGVSKRSEQKKILAEWVEFLAGTTTRVTHLDLVCRVPQELLDAAGGQPQLKSLSVKWGPYSDLGVLSSLEELRTLSLGGARAVTDLRPLATLDRLQTLVLDQPFSVSNPEVIGQLRSLETLAFGNGHLGSDRTLDVVDLEWIRLLPNLRTLHLPGTRLPAEQLATLAALPSLVELQIPLRREYRKTVFELAHSSKPFARLAKEYEALEAHRAASR
ncbi:hypothetical protein LQ757_18900 [Agromyces sp. SYSU K20354]|uniref:hypothetical protein n=1 Tax=Agromyces cavernae TaxID=2898659 RepID=UPI001E5FF468|nr:hypothetical protein [Agromyces cavernae]MCD2444354.1 hypothetical protein [Agromyces cavernae]